MPTSLFPDSNVIPISSRVSQPIPPQFKSKNFGQSVSFAVQGLKTAFRTERNFRIHIVMAVATIAMGALCGVSTLEWGALALCIAGMMATELLNTAIEYTVDLITGGIYHEKAKFAKDIAAGACLIVAFSVAIVGAIIFIPHIVALIKH